MKKQASNRSRDSLDDFYWLNKAIDRRHSPILPLVRMRFGGPRALSQQAWQVPHISPKPCLNARREATASAIEAQPSRSQEEKHVVFRSDCCLAVVSHWSLRCQRSDGCPSCMKVRMLDNVERDGGADGRSMDAADNVLISATR
jgi:hypothetical protein